MPAPKLLSRLFASQLLPLAIFVVLTGTISYWFLQQQQSNLRPLNEKITSLEADLKSTSPLQDQEVEQLNQNIAALNQQINFLLNRPEYTASQKQQVRQRIGELKRQFDTLTKIPPKDRLALERDLAGLAKDQATLQNGIYTGLVQMLGTAFFFVTIYFTWINFKSTQEKQITERFSQAIELLGNPNKEVRLGGIYALERIARDSERDYWTVIEVLTSFIREVSRRDNLREVTRYESKAGDMVDEKKLLVTELAINEDIQAALNVIERRTTEWDRGRLVDLSDSRLVRARLTNAQLDWAKFNDANLQNAYFGSTKLRTAQFARADLTEAMFSGVVLTNAIFWNANLTQVAFSNSDLSGVSFMEASLARAYFARAKLYKASFQRADLRDAHFSEADLREANLERTDLREAYLRAVNLQDAVLKGAIYDQSTTLPADLDPGKRGMCCLAPGAQLSEADLSNLDLSGVDLHAANLSHATLFGTIFKNANLEGSDLSQALFLAPEDFEGINLDLSSTNLKRANLSRVSLVKITLNKANLEQINLSNSNLADSKLSDISFRAANLTEVTFHGAILNEIDFETANLSQASFLDAIFTNANFRGANLKSANFRAAKGLSTTNLKEAVDLSNCVFSGVDLQATNLNQAILFKAEFARTNLTNASLKEANLKEAQFWGANLTRANLEGSNLSGALLIQANLEEAKLDGADLRGAVLSGANLQSASLLQIKFDDLDQIKSAENWETASYDEDVFLALGLPNQGRPGF